MYKDEGMIDQFFKLKPKLTDTQQRLLNAFYRLCTERNYASMSPLPIKESDIHAFTLRNDTAGFPVDIFIDCISAIDNHWLQRQADKQKSKINE